MRVPRWPPTMQAISVPEYRSTVTACDAAARQHRLILSRQLVVDVAHTW
ncbi:hypothetical protein [Streptomyces sp. NBC_01538]